MSTVIATLMLIAMGVSSSVILYAFVTGLIGSLTTTGAGTFTASGSLTVPDGSGPGTLIVTIKNGASEPITSITVSVDPADGAANLQLGGTTYTPGGPGFKAFTGSLATTQTASGEAAAYGFVAGGTYSFTIAANFPGGGAAKLASLTVKAQL